MKRFALMLIVVPVIILVLVGSFILWRNVFSDLSHYGQEFAALILAFVELLTIIAGMILLHQYFRDRRPHRFLFEGFKNEADVLQAQQKPANLGKLAQEELATQFEELYDQLFQYSNHYNHPRVVIPEVKKSSSFNIGIYLPTLRSKNPQIKQVVDTLVEKLQDIVQTLGSTSAIDASANALENIAPQSVGPIMPLFDMLVTPDIFKVTGYLQSKDNGVGITLELTNPRHHHPLIHTFWHEVKNPSLPDYINLLGPAMRWLMLQIWERDISQRKMKGNRKSRVQKDAVMLSLLGTLYYASADQFEEHRRFFLQSAATCFQEVLDEKNPYLKWWVPYLYLANIYRFEAQSTHGEMQEMMLTEAKQCYEKASTYADKEDEIIKDRITVEKAIALGMLGSDKDIQNVATEVHQVTKKVTPCYFDESQAEHIMQLLYSLATWYQIIYDKYASVEAGLSEPDKDALYYLAAALVHSKHPFSHSEYLWEKVDIDQNFETMRKEYKYLQKLKDSLSTELEKYPGVVKWKNEHQKSTTKEEDLKKLIDETVERAYQL